jgi:hypothetical protein
MELGRPGRQTPHSDTPEGPPAPQTVTGGVERGPAEFGTSSAPCSLTFGEHKALNAGRLGCGSGPGRIRSIWRVARGATYGLNISK